MRKPVEATRFVPAGTAVALCLGAVALAGPAVAAPQSTEALYACAANTDAAARLACFDAEVTKLKAAETGGEVAVVTREEVKEAERGNFGLSGADAPGLAVAKPKIAVEQNERLTEVTVTVATVEKKLDGKLRIVTSDGQVWVQTDSTDARVRGDGPWQATIKAAMMGSYMLKIEGARAIKARREK
jgi:hypothetical protein